MQNKTYVWKSFQRLQKSFQCNYSLNISLLDILFSTAIQRVPLKTFHTLRKKTKLK